jgi:hypothetical protein
MASDNYNPYNYPYQQSSAQQYGAYATAPASNNVAAPRQHQQPVTSQANDYISYQGQTYNAQGSGYGARQDNTWAGGSYGGNRETTSRAAEVLHSMSNNSYTTSNTGAAPSTYTAVNGAPPQTTRYSTSSTHSPQTQPQQLHAVQSTYGQSQNRPRSVNTNRAQQATGQGLPSPATTVGHPSQRSQTIYHQQQQQQPRTASPAPHQYSNNTSIHASSARNSAVPAGVSQQYTDYDRRQLASVEASRTVPTTTSSTSYNYTSAPTVKPPGPIAPPASSVATAYTSQASTTVDPMAVYDPWPEYQRKQEALRAQKAVEDAARGEEERIAEEARKVEAAKKEEERRLQEARATPAQLKKQQSVAGPASAASNASAPAGRVEALEAEMRAMMAKMRELNGKDPALLARIWEEERKAKALPKSPTVQNKATTQTTAVATTPAVQTSTPRTANQRKKAAPKETHGVNLPKTTTPAPAPAPMPTPVASTRLQAQAVPIARPNGNTVWPPERRAALAAAAATYLNNQNTTRPVNAAQILNMLEWNPSYIELCEQLELMSLKLDRAAFAKTLLTAVPDVNSTARKAAPQPPPVQRAPVPPAIMKKEFARPAAISSASTPAAASSGNMSSYPSFPNSATPAVAPVPVAEMVPIKPELKPPANKEEAARKRNISDLIDMTLLSDDEEIGPPPKRPNVDALNSYRSPYHGVEDAMIVDSEPMVHNFPIHTVPARTLPDPIHPPVLDREKQSFVKPLDKKKALRRNNYNPATIARDVLIACGRHPSERHLNQHLIALRSNLPHIGADADLSTLKWDVLDPGNPPPGYFKDSVQALNEDADDEDDSEDEDKAARPRAQSNAIGSDGGAKVQALPEATNPFQPKKRRGRPPRHSLPNALTTPKRSPSTADMSASAPRPSGGSSVGYSAFRTATEYGPDGQPLPKKRGRPVGWRKAIHGSVAAQARPSANGHTGPFDKHQPSQASSLRNVKTGGNEPIRIDSRSPSIANRMPRYKSYKCKWQNCTAELHNLETLKKHVYKVHHKETAQHTLECLWGGCGTEVTNYGPNSGPHAFDLESDWHSHIQQHHFDPLSWELGNGPASGLSGNED